MSKMLKKICVPSHQCCDENVDHQGLGPRPVLQFSSSWMWITKQRGCCWMGDADVSYKFFGAMFAV